MTGYEEIEQKKKLLDQVNNRLHQLQRQPEDIETFSETDLFGQTKTRKIDKKLPKIKKQKEIIKQLEKEIQSLETTGQDEAINKTARQLASWDPYDQNASSPFFDPEWMFDVKDGFDVVIGNPPYGIRFTREFKNKLNKLYKYRDSEYESYILFIEKGLSTLSKDGQLCYIIPSNISTNFRYENIREHCLRNKSIMNIIDLGSNVFESASVDSCIFMVSNRVNIENKIKCGAILNKVLTNIKYDFYIQKKFLNTPNYIFNFYVDNNVSQLLEKIRNSSSTFLEDYINFSRGIEFGYKSDIVYDSAGNNRKPLIAGRCFSRYSLNFEKRYIEVDFSDKSNFKTKEIYESQKIFVKRIGKEIVACLDDENYYNVCDVYNLLPKSREVDLYEILGIINSSLINFYFRNFFKNAKVLFPKIPIKYLKKVPIKISNGRVSELANKIQKENKTKQDVSKYIQEIDLIIYELFNLTEDEVKIIESENK